MNLHEPVIINDVEKAQDQSIDKLYDAISNDSKDNTAIESDRIIYSRDQLIRIYKLNKFGHLDQVINNPNFPKRVEMQSSEDYFIKLIEFDCSSFRCPTKRINKPENGNNIKHKKELGFNDDEERGIEQFEPNNLRLNRQFVQPPENLTKPEFSKSAFNNNGNYNNNLTSSSNFNKNININSNHKFNERSQMFNNRNDRMEDRNDGRSFLRSRGENLDQNFASFRRFPNRNQNASNNNNNYKPYYHNQRDAEPEWFTDPITQHDTIELKGFDDDEDKLNLNKNSNVQKQLQQPQTHQQEKTQNHSNQSPISQSLNNEKQKDDFDLSELTNFDWQSVDAKAQQDTKSIDYQADSSRFARWFNEPALVNSVAENQIEKLFSSARSSNNNNGIPNSPQQINHTQQQINLQNDFFGNLMNRSNNSQHQNPHSQNYHQQAIKQSNDYQQTETAEFKMNNQLNKKTDQQLLNILQKARINVDSLFVQQNVNPKNNVIKGEVKSAEELEASLLNNTGENNANSKFATDQKQIKLPNVQHQIKLPSVQHQKIYSKLFNPTDLFQKASFQINEAVTQDQSSKKDSSAINPFVLNLLDNAQNKPQKTVNFGNTTPLNNKKPNYPFMPTSVIRKIANDKNNLASVKSANEANFETVTGNLTNERSFVGRENLNLINNTMHQNNMMHQNFAIATGMRWNNNNVQFHRVDSTTPDFNYELNEDVKTMNTEALKNILLKASKKTVDPHAILNNFSNQQPLPTNHQFPKVQNDNQKKLIEILQKASTNHGKPESGNKINNWFELELKRNNDHLSPIIKENAFTLEDIEKS